MWKSEIQSMGIKHWGPLQVVDQCKLAGGNRMEMHWNQHVSLHIQKNGLPPTDFEFRLARRFDLSSVIQYLEQTWMSMLCEKKQTTKESNETRAQHWKQNTIEQSQMESGLMNSIGWTLKQWCRLSCAIYKSETSCSHWFCEKFDTKPQSDLHFSRLPRVDCEAMCMLHTVSSVIQ